MIYAMSDIYGCIGDLRNVIAHIRSKSISGIYRRNMAKKR